MNMNPVDPEPNYQAASAGDEALAARLCALAPAPSGIDPAVTFYRAGFAAAEAAAKRAASERRRSHGIWSRMAAACLLAAAAAGPAGYLIGRQEAAAPPQSQLAQQASPRDAGPIDPPRAEGQPIDQEPQTPPESSPSEVAGTSPAAPAAPEVVAAGHPLSSRFGEWLFGQLLGDPTGEIASTADPWTTMTGSRLHRAADLERLVRVDLPPRPPVQAASASNSPPREPTAQRPKHRLPTRERLLEELLH